MTMSHTCWRRVLPVKVKGKQTKSSLPHNFAQKERLINIQMRFVPLLVAEKTLDCASLLCCNKCAQMIFFSLF